MSEIEIDAQTLCSEYLFGHAEVEPGEHGGLLPHRLPAAARAQCDDPLFRWVEASPAGVRLRLRTAASRIELRLAITAREPSGRPVVVPRLTLRDGDSVTVLEPERYCVQVEDAQGNTTLRRSEPALLVIERAAREELLELLLPHHSLTELISLRADAELTPAPVPQLPRWIHHGSSISHCFESPSPDRAWPAQVARSMGWELRDLSLAGNAQLDPFVARFIRDTPAELITLKLGINVINGDTMRRRAFGPAVHGFIETIREGHPHTPLVVITAISCPIVERTPGPVYFEHGRFRAATRELSLDDGALTLEDTRELVGEAVLARSADPNIHLLDGLELFGHADAHLLCDDLHPDQRGYDLIAQRFIEKLPVAPRALGGPA